MAYAVGQAPKMGWSHKTLQTPTFILTLLNISGIGPRLVQALGKHYCSKDQILDSNPSYLKVCGAKRNQIESLLSLNEWEKAFSLANSEMETAERIGVKVIHMFSDEYPLILKTIANPPPIIYVLGRIPTDFLGAACVGTREPTDYGNEVTRRIVRFLCEKNVGIVSGLALGIDTIAHKEALKCKSFTLAVLGNGLDSVYPAKNRMLAADILDTGGALISEVGFGKRAMASSLIQRDRIQSGLSAAVIPMQSDLKGGTMHTIRFGLEQGRLIAAPVAPARFANEEKNAGINALLSPSPDALRKIPAWSEKFVNELVVDRGQKTVASAIRGKEDYPDLLDKIFANYNRLIKML